MSHALLYTSLCVALVVVFTAHRWGPWFDALSVCP